jgi:transcriptional regulator with XRE-family HTH domain
MFEPQLDPIIVGQVIAKFRVSKGMTQEVLSGFADIARGHLAMIERGERKPTMETLYRISRALDVKMSTIVLDIEKELEQKE